MLCCTQCTMHCQWGRKPLPGNKRCGQSSTCRRSTEPRTQAVCTKKLGKDRARGSGNILADRHTHTETRQTDILITILRNCSSWRSNNTGDISMVLRLRMTKVHSLSRTVNCMHWQMQSQLITKQHILSTKTFGSMWLPVLLSLKLSPWSQWFPSLAQCGLARAPSCYTTVHKRGTTYIITYYQ